MDTQCFFSLQNRPNISIEFKNMLQIYIRLLQGIISIPTLKPFRRAKINAVQISTLDGNIIIQYQRAKLCTRVASEFIKKLYRADRAKDNETTQNCF